MMKKLNYFIWFSIFLSLTACKKDQFTLPPETQTGAGTFGCKINGKVWVPRGSDGYSGQNIKAYYQKIYSSPSGFVFNVAASNYDRNPLESISFGTDSLKLFQGSRIKLSVFIKGITGTGGYQKIGETTHIQYITDSINEGEIVLNKLDEINRIVSGTFWFNAKNNLGEIIHITEGRFDVKFTR